MKIFNIQNTRRFFERLSECEGDIEIVNEEGMHLSLFDGDRKNLNILATTYVDGNINAIELYFQKSKDALMFLEFLASM